MLKIVHERRPGVCVSVRQQHMLSALRNRMERKLLDNNKNEPFPFSHVALSMQRKMYHF